MPAVVLEDYSKQCGPRSDSSISDLDPFCLHASFNLSTDKVKNLSRFH